MKKVIAFADGEIESLTDVRINNKPVNSLSGCSYNAYTGDGTQPIDSRVTGADQKEKAKKVGGLKDTAYIALTAQAGPSLSGGINLTTIAKGSKVKVYSDPENYTVQYSNNPAFCILDFLTRYNGCGININEIDVQSFIESADYCDELISEKSLSGTFSVNTESDEITGSGTKFKEDLKIGQFILLSSDGNEETKEIIEIISDTELKVASNFVHSYSGIQGKSKQKRFTLNMVLDERKPRMDWLENLIFCCRAYLIYQNGKLVMKIEKEEPTMQLFDKDSILSGTERFWTTPREKKVDICKVQYIDPDNEYARIYARAEAEEFSNEQPIVQETQAFGVTNFNQASRLAWFHLNQALTCDKFIAFQTSQEGLDRTVGDVIEITSTFLGYENKKMRIINMAEAQEGQIEVICKEYNENIYNDTLGSEEPVIETIDLPSMFDEPPMVENLNLEEVGWMTNEGNHIATIRVSFDEVDFQHLSHYEINYSEDDGITWISAGISYDGNHVINNIKTNQYYRIAVETVTHRGVRSEKTHKHILTTGKDNLPASVPTFAVVQKGDYLKAFITLVDEPDIKYYEIRQGSIWDTAELVQQFTGKSVMFRPTKAETATYLVKAVDNYGNYSETPTKCAVNVQGLIPKNIVLEENFSAASITVDDNTAFIDSEGDLNLKTNTETGQLFAQTETLLPLIDTGINFMDYRQPKETGIIVEPDYFQSENNQVETAYRSGYEDYIGWNYAVCGEDEWEETLPIKYNWDDFIADVDFWDGKPNVNWSEWKNLKNEPEFCGQFAEVKLLAKSLDGSTNIDLSNVTVKTDIEDVEDTVKNVSIPAEKITVMLNKNFSVPPTITVNTVDSTGKVAFWRMTNITNNSFDIELLDKDDNLIEGKILHAVARGY